MLARLFFNAAERRLRAPWRLLAQALMTLIIVVVLGVAVMLAVGIHHFDDVTPSLRAHVVLGSIQLVVMVGTVLFCGVFLDRRRLRDFGLRLDHAWWADCAFGLALGCVLQGLVFLVELACGWVEVTGYAVPYGDGSFSLQLIGMLVFFAGISVQEELFSRGYQLKNLSEGLAGVAGLRARGAIILALLLSSSVFAAMHVFNEGASWISTAGLALAGVLLAMGMLLTGELAIPIGLHCSWNFAQGNVFGFPVSGTNAGPTLIAIEQGGPAWMTGGRFGPEAGALGVGATLLGIAATVLWVRRRRGRVALHVALAEPELRHRPTPRPPPTA